MKNKNEKYDANEFRIKFKETLSQIGKNKVISAIQRSPQYSRYYHLQHNDWHQLRSSQNQELKNIPDIEILLKDDFLLIMRPVDNKPWWTQLDSLKNCLKDNIEKVSVTVENYWE